MSWQSDLLPYVPLGPYSHIDSIAPRRSGAPFPPPFAPPSPQRHRLQNCGVPERREESEALASLKRRRRAPLRTLSLGTRGT